MSCRRHVQVLYVAAFRACLLFAIVDVRKVGARCRWGMEIAGGVHTSEHTWRIDNASKLECKSSCDSWSNCRGVDLCEWEGNQACVLHSCRLGLNCFVNRDATCAHTLCSEQPTVFIVAVCLLSVFVSAAAMAVMQCMVVGKCVTGIVGISVGCIAIILGMLPVLTSARPELCAQIHVSIDVGREILKVDCFPT